MSGYILGVIGAVLVSAVLSAILPEGKTNGLIRSIMKIICIFTIVAPIVDFIGGFGWDGEGIFDESVINSDPSFIDYCSKISVEEAREKLENAIEEEFDVEIDLSLEWRYLQGENEILYGTYEDVKIEIVKATVRAEEDDRKSEIEAFIQNTGIGEVEFVE